jgi:hypothetical protein
MQTDRTDTATQATTSYLTTPNRSVLASCARCGARRVVRRHCRPHERACLPNRQRRGNVDGTTVKQVLDKQPLNA